jgi:hypothetical protein
MATFITYDLASTGWISGAVAAFNGAVSGEWRMEQLFTVLSVS